MWGFRVLKGKRNSLIWGCKEEEKVINVMVFRGGMNKNSTTRKRKEKKKTSHEGQDASMLNTIKIFTNQFLHSLSTLSTNIHKYSFLY